MEIVKILKQRQAWSYLDFKGNRQIRHGSLQVELHRWMAQNWSCVSLDDWSSVSGLDAKLGANGYFDIYTDINNNSSLKCTCKGKHQLTDSCLKKRLLF